MKALSCVCIRHTQTGNSRARHLQEKVFLSAPARRGIPWVKKMERQKRRRRRRRRSDEKFCWVEGEDKKRALFPPQGPTCPVVALHPERRRQKRETRMEWWVPFTAKFKATFLLQISAAREVQFPSSSDLKMEKRICVLNKYVIMTSPSSCSSRYIKGERKGKKERKTGDSAKKKLGSNLLPRRRMELAEEKRKGKNLPPHFPLV